MFYDQSESQSKSPEAPRPADIPRGHAVSDALEGAFLAPGEALFEPGDFPDSAPVARDPGEGTGPVRTAYEREWIQRVWEFAEAVPGVDPSLWRRDEFGAWIHRFDYGRRASAFGWEIFDPGIGRRSHGVFAMRPMQWEGYLRLHAAFA